MTKIKIIFIFAILFFGVFGLAKSSEAATYYVDNNATGCVIPSDVKYNSDTRNCGSGSTTVYSTIQGAANVATIPGDKVIVKAGTYNERPASKANGVLNNQITFQASGAVYIQGFDINHNYITVDGFDISNSVDGGHGVYGASVKTGGQIINNKIHDLFGKNKFGIKIDTSTSNFLVKGNIISNIDAGHIGNISVSIWGINHLIENNNIGNTSCDAIRFFGTGHIFRGNFIHNIDQINADGCHADAFQTFNRNGDTVADIIIERNYIKDLTYAQPFMIENTGKYLGKDSSGNLLYAGSDPNMKNITFRNNIFENVSSTGNTYVPTNFYNNTWINSGYRNSWVIAFKDGKGSATGSVVINNMFINCGTGSNVDGYYNVQSGLIVITDYDLFYPLRVANNGHNPVEAHGINGQDPLFENLSASDFTLKSESPAIDAGVTIAGFSDDYLGVSRPKGFGWDIGAYEFISGGIPTPDTTPPAVPSGFTVI